MLQKFSVFNIQFKKRINDMIEYLRRLKNPVIITGTDFFGRPSRITFEDYPGKKGFFFKHRGYSEPIQLSASSLSYLKRRVTVAIDEIPVLNVFEHLGSVLRFGLFDGIIISCDSTWPPYHGRPLEVYQELLKNSVEIETKPRWTKTHRAASAYNHHSRQSYTAIHSLDTGEKPHLEVRIICDYKGLGRQEIDYVFPGEDPEILTNAFSVYAQGWPIWTYYPVSLLGILGWPHARHVTWKQKEKENTLELFCLHRLCDLLVTLSLVHPTKFFTGRIVSFCSGHEADVKAISEASSFLINF